VSEVLRNRIEGLHQVSRITNTTIEQEYEPIEEGLKAVKVTRILALLEIVLTKEPSEEQLKEAGYQAPLPNVQNQTFEEILGTR